MAEGTTHGNGCVCRCMGCGAERQVKPTAKGLARLPRGWKRHEERTYCGGCWGERYVLRAVTIPLAGPVDAEWSELRAALDVMWRLSTACANWMIDQLRDADVRRPPASAPGDKMPAMPRSYLYPQAVAQFGDLPCEAIVAMEQAVTRKYRAVRYQVLWQAAAALPSFRYPYPYAVGNQSWSATSGAGGEPLVSVRIGRRRFLLRLRAGKEFRRQLAQHRQLAHGEAIPGELAIYRRSSPGKIERGDGKPQATTVMVKLVAWLPRRERRASGAERFLSLRTDADALLYGVLEDREEPWIVNGDRVRDWIHQHDRWLQRTSEDLKHERRLPKRRRALVNREYAERARKHRDRLNSFISECASWCVQFAMRNQVTRISYDDRQQGFVPRFPWAQLRQQLAMKCDEAGITFEPASGGVAAETAAPLASDETTTEET